MQNLFVNDDEEFIVYITVATDKDGTIFCDINEESLRDSMKGLSNIDECEFQTYKTVFKKPSFGDTVDLYDTVFSTNETGISFNPLQARYRKISALIKSWDLMGRDEKPTNEQIMRLHPVIANALGIQLDVETGGLLA